MQGHKDSQGIQRDLIRLMLVRVILVSLFLGVSVILLLKEKGAYGYSTVAEKGHFILIGMVYAISLLWAAIYNAISNKIRFAYTQLFFDSLTITGMVYITGGVESIFSLLYFPVIIFAGSAIGKRCSYFVASVSGILYGVMVDLQYYGVIHPIGFMGFPLKTYPEMLFLYRTIVHFAAFYLVAFLTGLLTQRLKISMIDLNKLQALTTHILTHSSLAIIVLDNSLNILYMNPKATEILEYNVSSGISKMHDILPNIDISAIMPQQYSEPIWIKYKFRKGNDIKDLEYMISALPSTEEEKGAYVIFLQDVTSIRRLQEELKRMENLALIGGLASRLAHEIKNPLAVMSTSLEILKQDRPSGEMEKRLFGIVFREMKKIEGLTRDLLYLARPKKPLLKKVNIRELLEEIIQLTGSAMGRNERISLKAHVPDPFWLWTDPDLLRQAIGNVLVNACEAIDNEGKVEIVLEEDPTNAHAIISVRDSGPGFDEYVLANLFTPFYTTKEKGSGLGLAIVKALMDALRGGVSVENLRPKGAMVSLRLPLHTGHSGQMPN